MRRRPASARKMRIHFRKVKRLCRCPFLQNVNTLNHFLKTQAIKNQELQVLVTIFLRISCRNAIAFLQNDQIFKIQRRQDLKNMRNHGQVQVTIFLTTSSHNSRNAIAFLQNDQLSNNHQTLDHQGRGNPSLHLKKPRRSPTMSPMSRWKALRSTSRTSERGLTRC